MPRHATMPAAAPEHHSRTRPELTLQALLRRAIALRGDAPAMAEAPDTTNWYHRGPRNLSLGAWAERAENLGAAMLELGLAAGDRVIVQLPNVADLGAVILGLAGAGLVPCPVPMGFAEDALHEATEAASARAIITTTRFGRQRPAEAAVGVAAALFGVRFVCGFGGDLPDGVAPLDGWQPGAMRNGRDAGADDTALVTFERRGGRLVPMARSHRQIVADALAVAIAARCDTRTTLVSTLPASSALGVAANLLLPLLTGTRLHLHGPFSSRLLITQLAAAPGAQLLVPAALAGTLADLAAELPGRLGTPLLVHRWPATGAAPPTPIAVVDLHGFGETALVVATRNAGRDPAPLPPHALHPAAEVLGLDRPSLETALDEAGHVLLRGESVASELDTVPDPTRWHDTGVAGRHLPEGSIALG